MTLGSNFDDFLQSENILEICTENAIKKVLSMQIADAMKTNNINKTQMAKKMNTSRSSLNRLLNVNDTSLTLSTLIKAASALGKTTKIELI
jgi:antitoxin HicB